MAADSIARAPGLSGLWFSDSPGVQMPTATDGGPMLLVSPSRANDNEQNDADARTGISALEPDEIASFHRVGQSLIERAAREGQQAAATAAVGVFREALSKFPNASSLHNGLGAALVELARTEPRISSSAALAEAVSEFGVARDIVEQAAMPATRLRYAINFATALWMQADYAKDRRQTEIALEALRSIPDLSESSPFWPHVQDNIGNALASLGHLHEAIAFYDAAIDRWRDPGEKARSESNRASAYTAIALADDKADGRDYFRLAYEGYKKALELLSGMPASLALARAKEKLGLVLLQEVSAGGISPDAVHDQLSEAIEAFEESRAFLRHRSPVEWAGVTTHLATALLRRGVMRVSGSTTMGPDINSSSAVEDIRTSVVLYAEAARDLLTTHHYALIINISTSCSVLSQIAPDISTLNDIVAYKCNILGLTDRNREGDLRLKVAGTFDGIIRELAGSLGINPEAWIGVIEDDQIVADILSILDSSGKPQMEWERLLAKVQTTARGRNDVAADAGSLSASLTPEEIQIGRDRFRLQNLQLQYRQRLESIVLPERGFQNREQYLAAGKLASTFQRIRRLQAKLGLEPMEKDARVTQADTMRVAHDRALRKSAQPSKRSGRTGRSIRPSPG